MKQNEENHHLPRVENRTTAVLKDQHDAARFITFPLNGNSTSTMYQNCHRILSEVSNSVATAAVISPHSSSADVLSAGHGNFPLAKHDKCLMFFSTYGTQGMKTWFEG